MESCRQSACLMLVTVLCTFVNTSQAQSLTSESQQRTPEEITVTGQVSLSQLHDQLYEAEDLMYDLFNELNDDDRYDIHCINELRTGTKIPKRVCWPNFVRNSTAGNAQSFLSDVQGSTGARVVPPEAEIRFRYPILQEKMQTLTRENPEFYEAVARQYELRKEYERRVSSGRSE